MMELRISNISDYQKTLNNKNYINIEMHSPHLYREQQLELSLQEKS